MTESVQHYIERMLGNVAGQDPMAVQAATPGKLEQLIQGNAAAGKLSERPAPGKWSVAEIFSHLAEGEVVTGWRMRQIVGAPGTTIQSYDQDAWAAAGHYAQRDARQSLAQFRAMREMNMAFLKLLTPEQWKHYGMHSERGMETVEHIVRMIAGHDVNHLRQVESILKSGE